MLEREEICLENDRVRVKDESKVPGGGVGGMGCVEGRESDELMILEACCVSAIRRNSVLEGLWVR